MYVDQIVCICVHLLLEKQSPEMESIAKNSGDAAMPCHVSLPQCCREGKIAAISLSTAPRAGYYAPLIFSTHVLPIAIILR